MTDGGLQASTRRRQRWHELPDAVRSAIEKRLGSRVVAVSSAESGFSPGMASLLTTVDGERAFVKAASAEPNREALEIYRREERVATALPTEVPAPRLLWSLDDGEWCVLAFEAIDGRHPSQPWQRDELDRVLEELTTLATLDPPPDLPAASDVLGLGMGRWRSLADTGSSGLETYPAWVLERLHELVELEAHIADAVDGDRLVHFDLRSDNLLLGPDGRVWLLDWPHALVGAPWFDLVCFLPSVVMDGWPSEGPGIAETLALHPLARGVTREQLAVAVATFAGIMVAGSLREPPPGIPHLRAFQRAQALPSLDWLRGLLP